MIVDVRLVLDRDGRWRVARVEGVAVPGLVADTPSAALALLVRRLRSAAWATKRTEAEELADPSSSLYSGEAPAIAPAPSDEGEVSSCR